TDPQNNERLLAELARVPLERRTAHYVCQLVLADPRGDVRAECVGTCQGRVRLEPAGTAGFGCDPPVEIVEYHHTFGELGEAIKSVLSHRARAIERFLPLAATVPDLGQAV